MKETTRRVQLTLPECKRLADILFDEVREELGLPDHIEGDKVVIDAGLWAEVLPKVTRAIKLAPPEAPKRQRKERQVDKDAQREP